MGEVREIYYEVYRKKAEKELFKIIDGFAGFNTSKEGKYNSNIVFYDTPENLLRSSKIILSTEASKGEGLLTLERDIEDNPNKKFIKLFEKYKFQEKIDAKSTPVSHLNFLGYSLSRCFTEPLTFDPDSLFKDVVPKMVIDIKNTEFKMVNAKGFKALLTVEQVKFQNKETRRDNFVTLLKVCEVEKGNSNIDYFEDLNRRLVKNCKFILEIDESKYKHSFRMTKKIEKKKEDDE